MMNNNKILTVSYGTFSCTLEGFDDSFDTMKAIAEYFRDLASDDRYFGAEPPQPDAEMLARIAEREVARRVEASEQDGRIMLKAHDDAPEEPSVPATPAVAAAVAAPEPLIAAEPAPIPEAAPEAAEDTPAFSAPYTDTPEPPAVEPEAYVEDAAQDDVVAVPAQDHHVAENLEAGQQDVFSVTESIDPSEEPYEPEVPAAADLSEPEPLSVFEEDAFEEDAQPDVPGSAIAGFDDLAALSRTEGARDNSTDDSAAAFFADSSVEDAADPETEEAISVEAFTGYISSETEEETPSDAAYSTQDQLDTAEQAEDNDVVVAEDLDMPVAPANESFADKLARIRAVVSQQDDEDAQPDYDEDEETASQPSDIGPLDDTTEFEQYISPEAAIVSEAAQDITEALEMDDDASAQDAAEAVDDDTFDDLEEALKRFDAPAASDEEASVGEDSAETDGEFKADTEFDSDADQEVVADAEHSKKFDSDNLFGSQDDETDSALGRVMKVNRADLDAALATGELEAYEDDSLANTAALSDLDEEDLQRELAEVEAKDDVLTDEDATDKVTRGALPSLDEDQSEDVSRLMAEADQQMEEPEGRTRRSAFSHLRAAVAARFADKSMESEEEMTAEKAEVYRSDLAEAVKPRRPESAEHRSSRPAGASNAPLKLVAEQRIDKEDERVEAIAPRRVAATLEDDIGEAEDTGFAAYAEEQGASSLPELLEAAASYLCFVEGHDQFSRPQLMTRVRQAECGDFTREDGLRSFGQLLRTGKIEKVKGGRFAASEAIGYKPDHRAAG